MPKRRAAIARPMSGLTQARIIDIEAYQRLRAQGYGYKRISQHLDCSTMVVHELNDGTHWQQNPEKVLSFNALRGTRVDPSTGIAPAEDMAVWGKKQRHGGRSTDQIAAAKALQGLGLGDAALEIADKLIAVGGEELAAPAKLDTSIFLGLAEERLYWALKMLTPDVLAKAGPRDLSSMISMLIEKRNLLKGEPTVITRSEHRSGLDNVAKLLLAEMGRRGITIEGNFKKVEEEF